VRAFYSYDADGRLKESIDLAASTKYDYDARGRPLSVGIASSKGELTSLFYEYDALGRRVMRLEAGVGGSRTLDDGLGFDHTMSMNLDATGSRAAGASKPGASGKYDGKYRYEGPGASESPGASATVLGAERNSLAVKGHPVAFTTKAGSYYLGQDRLGSTESISDSAGGIFECLEYDAFGSLVSGDPEAASLWGYAGKRYDPATGSYDYGFRDYAPSQGRFTSVDPIRDGANWYGYCDADPVNFVDLWGLSASDRNFAADVRAMEARLIDITVTDREIANSKTLEALGAKYGSDNAYGKTNSLSETKYDCTGNMSAVAQKTYLSGSMLMDPAQRAVDYKDVKHNLDVGTWAVIAYPDTDEKGNKITSYHTQMTLGNNKYFDSVPDTGSREGPSTTTTSTEKWLSTQGIIPDDVIYIRPRR
jgi:RHS repeat-associated protein